MVKGLVDKLKNTFRAGIIAAALTVGYIGGSGCVTEPEPVKPPIKQKPVAVVTASPMSGYAPLPVGFDLSKSQDPDGGAIIRHKIILGNGKDTTINSTFFNYTYSDTGSYKAGAIAYDDEETASDTTWLPQNIVVGKTPNQKPIAILTASPKTGYAPLTVNFNGSASYDVDGTIDKRFWDDGDDGVIDDSSSVSITRNYTIPGNYKMSFFVRDNDGALSDKKLENIVVTEQPDQIAFWNWDENIYKGNLSKTSEGKDTLINIVRLTNDVGQELEPAWSPDGKYIVFTSHRAGTDVWKMDENGANQIDISSNLVERARRAHWHSNGIVVAYTDKNETEAGIGIINPEGTSFIPIYAVPARTAVPSSPNPTWPKWSPDGTKIAFMEFDGDEEIYIMNTDGSGLEKLTDNQDHDTQPDWISNNEIIFMSNRNNGNLDLYKINVDTKEVTRLTSDPGHELDAISSSNGNKIVFVHDLASFFVPQIYTMNPDGTNWTQLTFNGANRYPAWRPKP